MSPLPPITLRAGIGSRTLTTVCAWCIADGSMPKPVGPVSHGICPRHAAEVRKELHAGRPGGEAKDDER